MAKVKGAIVVDIEKCKGCELCIEVCAPEALKLSKEVNGKSYHYCYLENPDACTGCINCGLICPDGVIEVYRVKVEVPV